MVVLAAVSVLIPWQDEGRRTKDEEGSGVMSGTSLLRVQADMDVGM